MRKSTLIMLGIMLAACFGMLFLANAYLSPLQEDVEAARLLTRQLEDRGDVVPGSLVKLRRLTNEPGRKGLGLLVELTPAPSVLARPRGLHALVRRAADAALGNYPLEGPGSVRWLRFTLHLPQGVDRACELERAEQGGLRDPVPALPDVWPPSVPPGAPRDPGPARGAEGPGAPGTPPGAADPAPAGAPVRPR